MPSIDSVITRAAATYPEHVAVHEWEGKQVTYSQLDYEVSNFAEWALTQGIQQGDAIAIHLPNSIAYLVAQFGSFRAGAVAAYINYRLQFSEARRQIGMCRARIVITTEAKAAELRTASEFADTIFLVVGAAQGAFTNFDDVINTKQHPRCFPDGLEDCDAIIRFTSGSTGNPKGLIVTHRAWLVRAMSMLIEEMQIVPGSTTLVLGQLSHQAGLFVIPTFLRGGTLLVMEKFSLPTVAMILSSTEISCLQIVPTMFTLILNDPMARAAFGSANVSRIVYGGSPIRQSVLEEVMQLAPNTEFVQSYGSHEAGSISVLDNAAHHDLTLWHSAGRPMLTVGLRLKEPVSTDGVGEIEVKSPWLPCARLTSHGREPIKEEWSSTGDLGEIMNGHIFLRDRMNDVIISGGFNVYPAEVEKVIGAHPQVLDAAVASAPDEKWGERVIAFVVVKRDGEFIEENLRDYCKTQLAGYKVPKEFRLIGEMPLNPNGKPDRRYLSQSLWAGQERRIN
ncbi:acyl--CoA ligase [Alcaligenaceae bacterium]|nr:acyl--CoA ligase [Alcaligenaceae bacterium]